MHSKVKSSFFLTLFAIVLSACGGATSSSPSSSQSSSSSSSASSSSSSSSSVSSSGTTSSPSSTEPAISICATPTANALFSKAPNKLEARSVTSSLGNGSSAETVTVTFDTKGGSAVAPVTVDANGAVTLPADPTLDGFTFEGWFRGKPGLTWLEPQSVTFPFLASEDLTLFAYWEPIDSKEITYTDDQTYFSTLPSVGRTILNPLTYEMSHENSLIQDMSTDLFTTEVDWTKAIADGVAEYVGDFSKIQAAEYSIESLDFIWLPLGATGFPTDSDGDDHTLDGLYNREGASQIRRTEWTYNIRDDIFFEDGLQVTASTFEYTLKQFLDPVQNNFRSTGYYKDADNPNGYPILGAAEYRKQTPEAPVEWSTVGFEIVDEFTFTITTWEAISQASALGFGNMDLVHPTVYEASLTEGVNSNYGTPANPYRSYGAYITKSWDENQRLVMNKNFDYLNKGIVTYKSIAYEFTATPAENMALFENGDLSAVGLIGEFYTEYAENPNVKTSWSGYPQYLIVNNAPSSKPTDPHVKSPITADEQFRQALFFGFDRGLYNSTIYAPNAPSLLPVPQDIKGYTQDPLYYMESPQHAENLEEFGITEGTFGYNPERAIELFEAALADFCAEYPALTFEPITLKMIVSDNALNLSLANWIKNSYETLFNEPGLTRFVINVVSSTTAATAQARAAWDFDLLSINLGFGGSNGVQWQYPGIAFIGGIIGAAGFGLHLPYASSFDEAGIATEVNLLEDPNSWMNAPLDIDLSVTLEFLESLGEDFIYELEVDEDGELVLDDDGQTVYVNPGHVKLYEALIEDVETGKPAGIYTGSVYDLSENMFILDSPFDGSAVAPFPGATQEVWNVVQAFERVFFEQMPLIPTSTLQSATLYADNVEILWPKYSTAFGWGASRYRFLSTDADFADGFFNSYAVPALEAAPEVPEV